MYIYLILTTYRLEISKYIFNLKEELMVSWNAKGSRTDKYSSNKFVCSLSIFWLNIFYYLLFVLQNIFSYKNKKTHNLSVFTFAAKSRGSGALTLFSRESSIVDEM